MLAASCGQVCCDSGWISVIKAITRTPKKQTDRPHKTARSIKARSFGLTPNLDDRRLGGGGYQAQLEAARLETFLGAQHNLDAHVALKRFKVACAVVVEVARHSGMDFDQ